MKACNMPAPRHSRFHVVYQPGRGCLVLDPDGRVAFGPAHRSLAEARCDALQAAADGRKKRGPRPCLCCGAEFMSEGVHNRMCRHCRGRGDPLDGASLIAAEGGRKHPRGGRA